MTVHASSDSSARGRALPGEARRFVRFPVTQRVDCETDGRTTRNAIADLSRKGAFLLGGAGLREGQTLAIQLALEADQAPTSLTAVVRRVVRDGDNKGAGLEFVDVNNRVDEFIESRLVPALDGRGAQPRMALAAYYAEQIGRAHV